MPTASIIIIITLMTKAVGASETSVYFNETTQRYTPEGCHLQPMIFHHTESQRFKAMANSRQN
jgi:hypothetical protein